MFIVSGIILSLLMALIAPGAVFAAVDAEQPTITTQPGSVTVLPNDAATLSVVASVSDGGTLSYQWYNSSGPISGAAGSSYNAPTGTVGTASYYVNIINTNTNVSGYQTSSTNSNWATVTVADVATPSFSFQPSDQTVNVNGTATLQVRASVSDGGTVSYQWYSNTSNSASGGSAILGATDKDYAAPTNSSGTTYYYAVVTNTRSGTNGPQTATATSSVAKVLVRATGNAQTPTITAQPASVTVLPNDTATLSVVASVSDGGTLSYQWYNGSGPIAGATGSSYNAPTGTVGTASYYVKIINTNTNVSGYQTSSTNSNWATVTVADVATPNFSFQPSDQTVNVNSTATLQVRASVSDGGTLSYQWYSNTSNSASGGTEILGATDKDYAAPTNSSGTTYYYAVVTNTRSGTSGPQTATATSSVAKVVVRATGNAQTPTITAQPASVTVLPNDTATLSVAASVSDGGTLSYQWYNTGGLISGATGSSYNAPTGTVGTAIYYVSITNTNPNVSGYQTGSTNSTSATVTVADVATPFFSFQPSDQTVNVNGTATLQVRASVSDGGTLSYQWYSNSSNSASGATAIPGATAMDYTAPTSSSGTTYYYAVVTNTRSGTSGPQTETSTSSVAKVVVLVSGDAEQPTITTQPASMTVLPNDTATLSVAASVSDGGTLSYQWYNTGGLISGATGSSYNPPTGTVGTASYYVKIINTNTNVSGYQTSSTNSNWATVTVADVATPSFSFQPSDQTVNVNGTATLQVRASVSDGGTLSYQWYSNTSNSASGGTAISGATAMDYTAPTSSSGTTYYYAVVTNTRSGSGGPQTETATSSVAKVVVLVSGDAEQPTITTQPASVTVLPNDTATLSVAASVSDGGTLSYQWYDENSQAISGAIGSSYTPPTATVGTASYYVVITNTNTNVSGYQTGSTNSTSATVTVADVQAPTITAQPQNRTVLVNTSVTLSVSASVSDGGTLSYQWYSNASNNSSGGSAISGATSTTYSAPTGSSGTGYYYVVVTNTRSGSGGSQTATTTSSVASVVVDLPPQAPADNAGSQKGSEQTPNHRDTPDQPTDTGATPSNGGPEAKETRPFEVTDSMTNDQKVTTATASSAGFEQELNAAGEHPTINVQLSGNADVYATNLTAQMVDDMAKQDAVLNIVTDKAQYTLPSKAIGIAEVIAQLGSGVSPEDVRIQVQVKSPPAEVQALVQSSAQSGGYTLVAPPVEFKVTAQYGDKVVEVSKFNSYVQRMIPVPEGIDPAKVTTAIVVEPDGSFRHVPTKIVQIDGRPFAVVNSLSNSVYALVQNVVQFGDLNGHWAQTTVNEMASRLIVSGTGEGDFHPDADVTRAEFAAILVRALGLKLEEGASGFSDIREDAWYSRVVATARAYHIIDGYQDGTFHPDAKVTREEGMAMIARAMKLTGYRGEPASSVLLDAYTDMETVSSWAQQGVIQCLQAQIVKGRSATLLAPASHLTRAEATAIVQRLLRVSGLL